MYIKTKSRNQDHERVVVSFERTDIIQISSSTFCYDRLSILNNEAKNSMGRFKIQLLLVDNTSVLDKIYLKMINILIHQLIGH